MQIECAGCLMETSSRQMSENSPSDLQSAEVFYGSECHDDGSATGGNGGCFVGTVVKLSRNV